MAPTSRSVTDTAGRDQGEEPQSDGLVAYDLRTEYRTSPLGIDERHPRFSWRLRSTRRGARQAFARISVVRQDGADPSALVWDSGWIETGDSFGIVYAGQTLEPTARYSWTLEIRDDRGDVVGPWIATFEMGLLGLRQQTGMWISRNPRVADYSAVAPSDATPSLATRRLLPAPHLRGTFDQLPGSIVRARLYASAHGVYVPFVNGTRIGDHELAPGWTNYHQRLPYQTFDVTEQIREGVNAVGLILGEGWWSGYVGSDRKRQGYHYGLFPEAWCELHIDFADGSRQTFTTDETWTFANGPILYSDLLMGERYDARRTLGDWVAPAFDDSDWLPVRVLPFEAEHLVGAIDEPVRVLERIPAVAATQRESSWVFDFGQNLPGRVALTMLNQAADSVVEMRYGEVLDVDGSVYTANLRTAEATDFYFSAGDPVEVFEPTFTTHGFRYMEVWGLTGPVNAQNAVAVVMGNDIQWAGTVETSDTALDQLFHNIRWTQRGNQIAVPTDCPQRDERFGWMGDAAIFSHTAPFIADIASFYTRWLEDVRGEQTEEGSFSNVAPKVTIMTDGAPAWGDAGVIIPWELYRFYGDRRILERSFDSMSRWVDYVEANNPDGIWEHRLGSNYGDWLPTGPPTSKTVISTAYFARSVRIVSRTAGILGDEPTRERYDRLARKISEAFRSRFVSSDGTVEGDTQTAYLLALAFVDLPDKLREQVAARLVQRVTVDGAVMTGFLGAPLICPVLADIGRPDLALELLFRHGCPSWLYFVDSGATTIWERWDGWTADRGFQSVRMNSFNHCALASIGEWLFEGIAGIRQEEDSAGFAAFRIAPVVGGGLSEVSASYESVRGTIRARWRLDDGGQFELFSEVPPGARARIVLPAREADIVREGGDLVEPGDGIVGLSRVDESSIAVDVDSGRFSFKVTQA
jgi:alpha-L-rhamnosidase